MSYNEMGFDENDIFDYFAEDDIDILFEFAFPPSSSRSDGNVLIPFLNACLSNLGWSRADLSNHSSVSIELINALFDGDLTLSQIDQEIINEISYALGYDPSSIMIFIEYENGQSTPSEIVDRLVDVGLNDEGITDHSARLDALQQDLLNILVAGLEGYFSLGKSDQRAQLKYQGLIERVEGIINLYRDEIGNTKSRIEQIRLNFEAEIRSMQSIISQLEATKAIDTMINEGKLQSKDNIRVKHLETFKAHKDKD